MRNYSSTRLAQGMKKFFNEVGSGYEEPFFNEVGSGYDKLFKV
jgi:hypothetical protein